jgi:hypothetical protein
MTDPSTMLWPWRSPGGWPSIVIWTTGRA